MVQRITGSLGSSYSLSDSDKSTQVRDGYKKQSVNDIGVKLQYDGLSIVNMVDELPWSFNTPRDLPLALNWFKFKTLTMLDSLQYKGHPPVKDVSFKVDGRISFKIYDTGSKLKYFNLLPYVDVGISENFYSVSLDFEKPLAPDSQTYLPTLMFEFNESDLSTFNGDFIKPIDYDKLRTRLSSLNSSTTYPWGVTKIVDIYEDLKWGYGNNDFNVGGAVSNEYLVDADTLNLPTPDSTRVITFVNVVNVYVLPARTPIQFSDFKLSYDIDSVAWNFSMTVPDKATANMVKPTQLNVIELEVNINGSVFLVFVAKTSTTKNTENDGTVVTRIKCSGFSIHKLLSHPYSSKKSKTYATTSAPSGILNDQLIGTGFTGTWGSVTWTLPANTLSYIDKSPLGVMSELASAVGAIILPTPDSKDFTIKPRYPISPWQWDIMSPDIALSENNFFSIDTEWIPQESPDSIYVFGEDNNGVAVKCTINGRAGNKTLPSVTNKYMTDTTPATERGRIEVAKNGFIEIVPVSTYVDPIIGIIQPLSLVEVTESDNVTKWKAQVVSNSLTLKRNGNALVQNLQLERHYSGI